MRGLVASVGFEQVAVRYERRPRGAGDTHFPLLRSWGPASPFVAGDTSFSPAPLVAFLVLGFVVGAFSAPALTLLPLESVVAESPSGVTWLVALSWSAPAFGIGVVGLHLERIHRGVRGRPRDIVESAVGFAPSS